MALRIATLLTVAMLQHGWGGMTDLPVTGNATFYSDGLMEQVARNRGMTGECTECVGYVAMPRLGDLRRKVYVSVNGIEYGPFLVCDVAAERDYPAFTRAGHVVEMSYEWAMRLGMRGPIPVEVFDKAKRCSERAMAQ